MYASKAISNAETNKRQRCAVVSQLTPKQQRSQLPFKLLVANVLST